jgi:hypothetical protein
MRTCHASAKLRGHSDVILAIEVQVPDFRDLDSWAAKVAALHDIHAHVAANAVSSDPNVP